MKCKKAILSLIFAGLMTPYVCTIQADNGWNFVTKAGEFMEDEKEIISEVMPTMVRKLAYAALAAIVLALFKKPIEKGAKGLFKLFEDIPVLGWPYWIYFEDDDDDESNKKNKNKTLKTSRPKKTLKNDIANSKLPTKMEKVIRKAKLGFPPRKALLLHGPTQNGKSLYCEVFGSEIERNLNKNVAMIQIAGSDLLSKWVGVTPQMIKDLGKRANNLSRSSWVRSIIRTAINNTLGKVIRYEIMKKNTVLIFIDEVDALFIGRRGESDYGFAATETLQVILDLVRENPNVFVCFTTNYTTNIPSAILSRCESIQIDKPNEEERKSLIRFWLQKYSKEHFKSFTIDSDSLQTIIDELSQRTEDMNKSDIIDICDEATFLTKETIATNPEKAATRQIEHTIFLNQEEFTLALNEKKDELEKLKIAEQLEKQEENRNVNTLLNRHINGERSPLIHPLIQEQMVKKKKKTIIGNILTDSDLIDDDGLFIPHPPKMSEFEAFLNKKIIKL